MLSEDDDDETGANVGRTLLAVLVLWAGAIAVCLAIAFFSGCARYPVYPNNTLEQTLRQGEHHCPQLEVDVGTCHP